MPLEEGHSQATISANIAELIRAGHERSQAAAIAYKTAGMDSVEFEELEKLARRETPAADAAPVAPHAGPGGRAAGIIFCTSEGDVLFMHRGDGGDFPRTWGFPGGHQEQGEDLEQCARRETLEETGLDYQGPLRRLYDDGQFCAFAADVDRFDVKMCGESVGFTWAPAPPDPPHPGVYNALRVLAAHTELDVAELMRDGVLPSPQRFENIYLVDLRITGTGMSFRAEVKEGDKVKRVAEHVHRDPQIYLNDEFLRRCNGLQVILDHPVKNKLDAVEYESRAGGAVFVPYIKGDEVWGIAKIYGQEAIDALEAARVKGKPISTSPTVVFDAASENVKVLLESGEWFLMEGKPRLLDHVAICDLGVWDKGGPATGVSLNNEGLTMTPEEQAAADKAKADAIAADKMKADAAEKERADKAKADSDKAVADAVAAARADWDKEAKEKADKMKADSEKMEKEKADKAAADALACADSSVFADAQARADSVYAMHGERAPAPLQGETPSAYRMRLLKGQQKHSRAYKDANLTAIFAADSAAAKGVEDAIYADSVAAARSPIASGSGLREIRSDSGSGHRISTFNGDPFAWMAPFMLRPKYVRFSSKDELSGRAR